MDAAGLVEPEFVAHVFAPLDGPDSDAAQARVRALWVNCRDQLGMDRPIVEVGLPAVLPPGFGDGADRAVAATEDAAAQFQMIARVEHDLLNVSFAAASGSRPSLSTPAPVGWHEFSRWWATLGGEAPMLGSVIVLLAKARDLTGPQVRTEVPVRDDDGDRWWESGFRLDDFAAWETGAPGPAAARRLVLLGAPDQDAELSRFVWSDGGTGLPPLGRYLMHAAKLRYLVRVHDQGRDLARLQTEVANRIEEVTGLLRANGRVAGPAAALAAAEAELAGALAALRTMRRSAQIAFANMTGALGHPLPADARLGPWLSDQLADDTEYLQATYEQVRAVRAALPGPAGREPAPKPPALPHDPAEPAARSATGGDKPPRPVHRVAFGVDVVSYSSRTTPQQRELQQRVAGMAERVLAGLGLELRDTDRQPAGDGMMVVLPPGVQEHAALAQLLHGWRGEVMADNARHPGHRIRLRLSVGSGWFTEAALGFSGNTIIAVGRLLDSNAVRAAVLDHPDADLVAIVSDRIFQDVVGEGYDGLTADEFRRTEAGAKTYQATAWLWTGSGPRPVPRATRDVFVIHGRDKRTRDAVFGLLRALDLAPLDWEEMVGRTGKGTPQRDEVVRQGFEAGPGALVVLTPDDVTGGAGDVLIRAGRALALQADRTILVEIGNLPRIRDLDGRETVRLDEDNPEARVVFQHRLAHRLRLVGYPVDTTGAGWLDADRFAGLT
ncbi:CATRA conflict system CASPASE/TPR repeat-associated protein [Paractinoplanes brasiliensis]|uniref:Putative nucleotide-binding protein with TIR-like domain n=1 Tax=Paractinoplanes brasiliensis TaxID=52695 RepID=A0A4R6J9T8_9ACTN|nr:CATRA conflict system CASPASE/TPR repeat-associated protein [Actinoplanes brasiliensis]TDO32252.1 putative nucleotide-binding protein with TIR-like domain [Actinoplanes brasiliensis]GID27879.1 hypothetical protein Abr02nite_28620 [Actinoplanes brasiliensis]